MEKWPNFVSKNQIISENSAVSNLIVSFTQTCTAASVRYRMGTGTYQKAHLNYCIASTVKVLHLRTSVPVTFETVINEVGAGIIISYFSAVFGIQIRIIQFRIRPFSLHCLKL